MRDAATSWIWESSAGMRGKVAWLAVCQVAHGLCGVAYALMLRGLVDSAVAGDAAGFWGWAGATTLLVAAQLSIRAVVRWLSELCRASLENALKLRLFDALLRGDYGRVAAVHSGEWMNRLTSDAKIVADGVTDIVPGATGMAAKLVGALAAAVWLDPRIAVVLLPGGAALVLFTFLFRRVLRRLHRRIQEADGRLRSYLQDRLGGMLTVRSFAAESTSLAGAAEFTDSHLEARMRRNRFSNLCNIGFGAVMSGAQLGAIVWCGYGILTGTMSFGTLMAMAQLVGQVQAPLANISGYLPRWYAMLGSAERLMEVEGLSSDAGRDHAPTGMQASSPVGGDAQALPLADMLALYESGFSAVGLDSVSYAYWPTADGVLDMSKDEMQLAVNGVSLEVRKNEFLALAGESGCGKSTTLRLLMGAYEPDVGKRYLLMRDGTRMPLDLTMRRLFAYVPQGNQLLGSTVREAVSLGDPGESGDDARLWEALRVACADEFVSELEGCLDAPLGERGAGLSEGQTQRIAVARAVFSESPILLLDEATSALDAATEARLLQNLRSLTDRTVVVVTHRPAALEVCDRVIEFNEGGACERV